MDSSDHGNKTVPTECAASLAAAESEYDFENVSSWRLAVMLVPASLRKLVAAIPLRIRLKIMTLCTLISLAAPLALWIAPSLGVWLTILGVSVGAIFLLFGLVMFAPEDTF